MPVIEVLGWVWMGIIIGGTAAVVWSSKYYSEEYQIEMRRYRY